MTGAIKCVAVARGLPGVVGMLVRKAWSQVATHGDFTRGSTGDGVGHTFGGPYGIAVDDSGNVYVTGRWSDNAFKIELCDTLSHYPLFEGCLTGPERVVDEGCACPDDDADGDVDLFDLARFQQTFVGP